MRLLIVSNRLPITVSEEEGKLKFKESAGGLVSGLSAYLDSLKGSSFIKSDYIWIGWPGSALAEETKEKIKLEALKEFNVYPVFLSEEEMEKFYHGFCNKTIWPLFHYFPSFAIYEEEYWIHYKIVNEIFCNAVLEIIKPDDIIWIHDYHLMLLPKLLRNRLPDNPIGFFLHIPFPSFEIFRLLPSKWRREILEGLLGADLVGFHTQEYTRYFLRCTLRILGYEHDMGLINLTDRMAKTETFPMGIDFQKYHNTTDNQEILQEKEELKKTLTDYKVILSIDRLDYTKGIINRNITWTPILYQYKFLPFNPLIAMYGVSDVCLVTPLRDGMNLVAKEYVAVRTDKTGVLILSEMAGAAKEMGEAIIINPNNIEELAGALKEALEMPVSEQIKHNEAMQRRLKRYDVVRWADDFNNELQLIKKEQKERFHAKLVSSQIKNQILNDFKNAHQKIIFLDYDGTLVPFTGYPQLAKPTKEILTVLGKLADKSNCDVIIVSGRDKKTMDEWFGDLNAGFVAEHGVWIKERNKDWILIKPLMNDWKPKILPLLETYADRLPGAFVEEKEFSLVWHYRRADPELSSIRAKELMDELVEFTTNIDIQILQGSKVIEVRNAGVNKGIAAMHFLVQNNYDFIMAIGDDWTDEDLFKALPEKACTIRVGMVVSYARFNMHSYLEVRNFIEELIK